jgi:hypothetical protein
MKKVFVTCLSVFLIFCACFSVGGCGNGNKIQTNKIKSITVSGTSSGTKTYYSYYGYGIDEAYLVQRYGVEPFETVPSYNCPSGWFYISQSKDGGGIQENNVWAFGYSNETVMYRPEGLPWEWFYRHEQYGSVAIRVLMKLTANYDITIKKKGDRITITAPIVKKESGSVYVDGYIYKYEHSDSVSYTTFETAVANATITYY